MTQFARSMRVAGLGFVLLIGVASIAGCSRSQGATVEGRLVVDAEILDSIDVCTLAVETISGGPAGETAMIVEPGGTFSWELPRGTYDLLASCGVFAGAERVEVPDDAGEEVEITVR